MPVVPNHTTTDAGMQCSAAGANAEASPTDPDVSWITCGHSPGPGPPSGVPITDIRLTTDAGIQELLCRTWAHRAMQPYSVLKLVVRQLVGARLDALLKIADPRCCFTPF